MFKAENPSIAAMFITGLVVLPSLAHSEAQY